MGKRKTKVVVSSSDDDDDDDKTFSLRSKTAASNPKSKSRPSSVPRANSSRRTATATNNARLSDSRAVSRNESSGFDEIKLFCEDFDEGFNGFRMSTGSGRSNGKDLWVDKYKPGSLEELAVHKRRLKKLKCGLRKD